MKKILILENGKSISNMISHLLNTEDYKILLSESYQSESAPAKQIPDLIIADLTSIKNGKVELLIELKNDPVISLVPFILITNNITGTKVHYSILNYYLNKPFTKDELFNLVLKIVRHTDSLSPW